MKFLEFATIKLADGSIVHTVLLSSIPLKKLKNRDTARARSAEDKINKSSVNGHTVTTLISTTTSQQLAGEKRPRLSLLDATVWA